MTVAEILSFLRTSDGSLSSSSMKKEEVSLSVEDVHLSELASGQVEAALIRSGVHDPAASHQTPKRQGVYANPGER